MHGKGITSMLLCRALEVAGIKIHASFEGVNVLSGKAFLLGLLFFNIGIIHELFFSLLTMICNKITFGK